MKPCVSHEVATPLLKNSDASIFSSPSTCWCDINVFVAHLDTLRSLHKTPRHCSTPVTKNPSLIQLVKNEKV